MDDLARRISELLRRKDRASVEPSPVPLPASTLLPGDVRENQRGSFQVIDRPIASFWPSYDRHVDRMSRLATAVRQTPDAYSDDARHWAKGYPQQLLYLDLETCGFSGSPLFLIGMIRETANGSVLTQLLARHYGEEAAVLIQLATLMNEASILVTYNGKSFDWPFAEERFARHRISGPALTAHIDLLHSARRRWKGVLPNCKLQTLEAHILHRHRSGDLGGREVATAYHDFVRTGRLTDIGRILKHNALDLVTLLQLVPFLLTPSEWDISASEARSA